MLSYIQSNLSRCETKNAVVMLHAIAFAPHIVNEKNLHLHPGIIWTQSQNKLVPKEN